MGRLIAAIVFMPICYLVVSALVSALAELFPTLFAIAGFITLVIFAFSEGGVGCGCLTFIVLIIALIFG